MFYSGDTNLKYYKRLDVYKNSTNSCNYSPSLNEVYSYNEKIVGTIKIGREIYKIFNYYSFSVTTSSHQSALRGFFGELVLKGKTLKGLVVELPSINSIYNKKDLETAIFENIESDNLEIVKELWPKRVKAYNSKREAYFKKEKEYASRDRKLKKLKSFDFSKKNIVKKAYEIDELLKEFYYTQDIYTNGLTNLEAEKLLLLIEAVKLKPFKNLELSSNISYIGNDIELGKKILNLDTDIYRPTVKDELKELIEQHEKLNKLFNE